MLLGCSAQEDLSPDPNSGKHMSLQTRVGGTLRWGCTSLATSLWPLLAFFSNFAYLVECEEKAEFAILPDLARGRKVVIPLGLEFARRTGIVSFTKLKGRGEEGFANCLPLARTPHYGL